MPLDYSYATATFDYQYRMLGLGMLTSMVAVEMDRHRVRGDLEDFPNIRDMSKIIEIKLSLYRKNEFLIDPFLHAFEDTIKKTCPDKKIGKSSEVALEIKLLHSELENIKDLSDERLKNLSHFFIEFNRNLTARYNYLCGYTGPKRYAVANSK